MKRMNAMRKLVSVPVSLEGYLKNLTDLDKPSSLGEVRFYWDDEKSKAVCIKTAISETERKQKQLKNEAMVLEKLEHPNIVKLLYVGRIPTFFIVEEAGSVSLAELFHPLGDVNVSYLSILQYMCQILTGLEYLHENKIMHGDLNPDNIVIFDKDNLKIIDFGASTDLSCDGWCLDDNIGSPAYRAPELASDFHSFNFLKNIDKTPENLVKADVFSAGCIFIEMITRRQLFDVYLHQLVVYLHTIFMVESLDKLDNDQLYIRNVPLNACAKHTKNTEKLFLGMIHTRYYPKVEYFWKVEDKPFEKYRCDSKKRWTAKTAKNNILSEIKNVQSNHLSELDFDSKKEKHFFSNVKRFYQRWKK